MVQTATGSVTFEVRSVRVIGKRALPLNEIFDRDGPPRLRIVSCGGAYLPAQGGYQDNIVVTAYRDDAGIRAPDRGRRLR